MSVDDVGHSYTPAGAARRVVSLVPSLTEALSSVHRDRIVGVTDWCTHPSDLTVPRVRGTKNPSLDAIRALSPDLVVANKEENREVDVRRLRDSGIAVWVGDRYPDRASGGDLPRAGCSTMPFFGSARHGWQRLGACGVGPCPQ